MVFNVVVITYTVGTLNWQKLATTLLYFHGLYTEKHPLKSLLMEFGIWKFMYKMQS